MSNVDQQISVGVQQLIEKLRSQGVETGRTEANRLVAGARGEAERILAAARKEAETIITEAKNSADFTLKSGHEALELATRNAVLELKGYLVDKFSRRITEAVGKEMHDQDLLRSMILEVAGRTNLNREERVQVVLPETVMGIDDLHTNPDALKEDTLAHFVAHKGHGMLEAGVTFTVSPTQASGITFRMIDKSVEVELDENAVSGMLLKHLQPRFRSLLEGTVK